MGAGAEGEDAGLIRGRARMTLALVALAILLVVGIVALRMRPTIVETALVKRGELIRTVVTSGRVEAPERTWLGTELGGRVVAVEVDEGEHVEQGQLLVRLDADAARDALAEAKAAQAEAEARLARERRTGLSVKLAAEARVLAEVEEAERSFERTQKLVEAGALSADRLDEARRRKETTAAELRRARAETESASAGGSDVRLLIAAVRRAQAASQSATGRLEDMTLVAPSAGTILTREVEVGQVVSPGQKLLEFEADGAPRLEVHPDEIHLAYMREGQRAVASVEAKPDVIFGARVARIAPSVDAARGTVKVELSIDPPVPDFLMTGMTVSVEIELARVGDALILPAEAVHEPSGVAPFALVVEDGRAARRDLRLGMRAGELFEVERGLREGERVIVDAPGPPPGTRVRPEKER